MGQNLLKADNIWLFLADDPENQGLAKLEAVGTILLMITAQIKSDKFHEILLPYPSASDHWS